MTDLSGRVTELETQIGYILQDLLRRPDIETVSDIQSVWNQSHTQLSNVYQNLDSEVQELQTLYANIVLASGSASTVSGLSETFETISKNLKQYPYSLSYNVSGYLTGIHYTLGASSYIDKVLSYDSSGMLTTVSLTGSPVPSTSLFKYLYYSGAVLTGVQYS